MCKVVLNRQPTTIKLLIKRALHMLRMIGHRNLITRVWKSNQFSVEFDTIHRRISGWKRHEV